jgi:threonine/homoserine/homoserine lactone efflux protein
MTLIFLGIALGLTVSLPPGPVAFETIKRGIGRGFWNAFPLAIGAALADLTYASLVYLGALKLINNNPQVQIGIYLIGGVLLIAVGITGIIQTICGEQVGKFTEVTVSQGQRIKKEEKTNIFSKIFRFIRRVFLGYTMTLFNPAGFLFFITIFPPIFANILSSSSRADAYLFVLGFPLGALTILTLEGLFASLFKKLLKDKLFKAVSLVLNFALLSIAIYFIYKFIDMI